ncbi:hypothetical protein PV325_000928 [Microctonus aethiopoides]|uniref:Nondiscriminating glutamyl-tRNA synthetase EARS2, mitochondrial n=1 Tax=Microctonus aethiopoides TaxID=144406 RepID=A0AA39C5L8_9HYME|nr:hypothetical protein PV325_000928 [Microctonus aethiopoides]KAK0158253.1 hypothetical protein PV328_009281 [Microctonus aethiopoides]
MQYKIIRIINNLQFIQTRCFSKQSVRVRFAPSPTGHLHLGGLRTALYNYLFARKNGGSFVLRIEDTDQTRLEPEAMTKLRDNLIWSGIIPDEDPVRGGPYGPYIQSKRLDIYKEQVEKLLKNGSAYYCFCSEHRLDLLRREALKIRANPKYDNRCRHLTEKEVNDKLNKQTTHCIRFKMSSEPTVYHDLVYGDGTSAQQEGDFVIMKADGYPTYHFANVVDDHLMKITHVLRGVEWQISTPKHIELYNAFGWRPPHYAHLPLILNTDGSKLSKRQGDIRVDSFREDGIFPLALLNYITQAGGGFNREPGVITCWSYEELIKQFDVKRINVNSSKLHYENLLELNRLEIQKLLNDDDNAKLMVEKVRRLLVEAFPQHANNGSLQLDDNHILTILKWAHNRMTRLNDLVDKNLAFLWIMPDIESFDIDPKELESLKVLKNELDIVNNSEFNHDMLSRYLKKFASDSKIKFPSFMKFLRKVLSGLDHGPSVAEMMDMLGKDKTLDRLNRFIR